MRGILRRGGRHSLVRGAAIVFFPWIVLGSSPAAAASFPPRLNFVDRVNPTPRPYQGRADVTTRTSLYFEVVVPDANGPLGKVNTDSITATLYPQGGDPVPMLLPGRVFASGFSGKIFPGIDSGSDNGDGVYIVPAVPLDPARSYTVEVYAETLDGVPIDPAFDSWSFTTRPVISDPTVRWSVDLAGPTVSWRGWFFSGLVKPNFDTSRLFDQLDSYDLMDAVRAANPRAWSLQRDWPLTSDYWHNGVFDGNPNLVRERETRRIVAIENRGNRTLLTVADLEEGPLYGIPPNRPLGDDFHVGDRVTIADREKYEVAEVRGVDEQARIVKVTQLATAPSQWVLDYPGSHPPDDPATPDNFTLPLCYLRKLDPVGTPVYYWRRLDDEWDLVHGQHGRRLLVNFSYTPLDLSSKPVPAHPGGHGSTSPPKDYLQWHDFVRQVVFHLIDRYGPAAQDFLYSVGNENNFSIFWSGTKDQFYELYDYTVNAVLTAFEDRRLDPNRVQVGGIEAASLGGVGWIRDALYHASGAADKPGGGIAEQNFVCADPRFEGKRAARVSALCAAHGGKGSPLDFVSIHEYEHAHRAASDLEQIRNDALAMDPVFYDRLMVDSFEATPDWIPRPDPASEAMYEGNGYFETWCADWIHRLVSRAESDPRYAQHEATLTVWPFDYNGDGITSVTGLIRVDEDGDGDQDRIATIRKGVFNFLELVARLGPDLDALPERVVEGIRFGAVRSAAPDAHRILLFGHDLYDTESNEETEFTASVALSNVPWPAVTVRRFRVDKDHSSPYRAYQSLPERGNNGLYTPEEVAPLEASDDLVEDGPPQEFDAPGGLLDLSVPLRVNGVGLVEIRERDLDGDGLGDTADNCPSVANPGQEDADLDRRGAACDCLDTDPGVWEAPSEVTGFFLRKEPTGETLLEWVTLSGQAGPATVYDVAGGSLSDLRSTGGFAAAGCSISGTGEPPVSDPEPDPPPGEGRYRLVRGRNGCGAGSYGSGSAGERAISACP
jgi:hypothetical protein